MQNRRKKEISANEKAGNDIDRSDLFEVEPDPEEIPKFFSKFDNNKGVVTDQLFEDLNAPASDFLDEEPFDQATPQTLDPMILIKSLSPKAPKSHILRRLSEDLPQLMVEKNKTMVESILQDLKERFGLSQNQIKAMREAMPLT